MDISPEDFLLLLQECDQQSEVLHRYNQKHKLLRFSDRDLSAERHNERNLLVVREYTPTLKNVKRQPTFQELLNAFGYYHADLMAAIAIEQAKLRARSSI